MIGKTQKIEELTREVEGLRDQLHRVKAERERLIQISNDLRADLNRSQRLANELMTKMTVTEPA
jgi:predicted RNase H-like nuclease (RuvC/YqgF family)